jgi:hypothetical protein
MPQSDAALRRWADEHLVYEVGMLKYDTERLAAVSFRQTAGTAIKYGRAHRLVRAKYAPIVRADDPLQRRYLGPSHRRCNRAVVTHLKAALIPEVQRHSREW